MCLIIWALAFGFVQVGLVSIMPLLDSLGAIQVVYGGIMVLDGKGGVAL